MTAPDKVPVNEPLDNDAPIGTPIGKGAAPTPVAPVAGKRVPENAVPEKAVPGEAAPEVPVTSDLVPGEPLLEEPAWMALEPLFPLGTALLPETLGSAGETLDGLAVSGYIGEEPSNVDEGMFVPRPELWPGVNG